MATEFKAGDYIRIKFSGDGEPAKSRDELYSCLFKIRDTERSRPYVELMGKPDNLTKEAGCWAWSHSTGDCGYVDLEDIELATEMFIRSIRPDLAPPLPKKRKILSELL